MWSLLSLVANPNKDIAPVINTFCCIIKCNYRTWWCYEFFGHWFILCASLEIPGKLQALPHSFGHFFCSMLSGGGEEFDLNGHIGTSWKGMGQLLAKVSSGRSLSSGVPHSSVFDLLEFQKKWILFIVPSECKPRSPRTRQLILFHCSVQNT